MEFEFQKWDLKPIPTFFEAMFDEEESREKDMSESEDTTEGADTYPDPSFSGSQPSESEGQPNEPVPEAESDGAENGNGWVPPIPDATIKHLPKNRKGYMPKKDVLSAHVTLRMKPDTKLAYIKLAKSHGTSLADFLRTGMERNLVINKALENKLEICAAHADNEGKPLDRFIADAIDWYLKMREAGI